MYKALIKAFKISEYQGFGSIDGSDGEINPPDSTITTAADLLTNIGGYKFKVVYTPEIVGVKDDFHKPTLDNSYSLEQNYPNPFNPETEIRFELPETNIVVIKVYNLLGEEIRTVTNAIYPAGVRYVHWDGKDNDGKPVVSGIYLYNMQAGTFLQTKKMILLR